MRSPTPGTGCRSPDWPRRTAGWGGGWGGGGCGGGPRGPRARGHVRAGGAAQQCVLGPPAPGRVPRHGSRGAVDPEAGIPAPILGAARAGPRRGERGLLRPIAGARPHRAALKRPLPFRSYRDAQGRRAQAGSVGEEERRQSREGQTEQAASIRRHAPTGAGRGPRAARLLLGDEEAGVLVRAALGCRVKSGWATAVLVIGPARARRWPSRT